MLMLEEVNLVEISEGQVQACLSSRKIGFLGNILLKGKVRVCHLVEAFLWLVEEMIRVW